jgi:hypothetical protein
VRNGDDVQVVAPVPEMGESHVGYTYRAYEWRLNHETGILQFRVQSSHFYVPDSPRGSDGANSVCPAWFNFGDDRFLVGDETHEMGVDKVLDLRTGQVATVDSWVGPRFRPEGCEEVVGVSRPWDRSRADDPAYQDWYAEMRDSEKDERYPKGEGTVWVPMEGNFRWLPKGAKYDPVTFQHIP